MAKKLTPKEERFVSEYLIDLDAKRAATVAGFAPSVAASKAYQWVSNSKVKPHVYAALRAAQTKLAEKTGITVERVLTEYAKLGFSNMADYMRVGADGDPVLDFSALSRDQAAALAEVTVEDFRDGRGEEARDVRRVKFKLSDKKAALDSIAKHLGMFVDKHEHSGPGGKAIEVVHTFESSV
jgi:phage terminase small subunit